MNKQEEIIKSLIKHLPEKPGVYQYYSKDNEIIYVGKAKNLKKRVSSYFNRQHYENNKLKVLVSKIFTIRHIFINPDSDTFTREP